MDCCSELVAAWGYVPESGEGLIANWEVVVVVVWRWSHRICENRDALSVPFLHRNGERSEPHPLPAHSSSAQEPSQGSRAFVLVLRLGGMVTNVFCR